jgi:hypothetical protein
MTKAYSVSLFATIINKYIRHITTAPLKLHLQVSHPFYNHGRRQEGAN